MDHIFSFKGVPLPEDLSFLTPVSIGQLADKKNDQWYEFKHIYPINST